MSAVFERDGIEFCVDWESKRVLSVWLRQYPETAESIVIIPSGYSVEACKATGSFQKAVESACDRLIDGLGDKKMVHFLAVSAQNWLLEHTATGGE